MPEKVVDGLGEFGIEICQVEQEIKPSLSIRDDISGAFLSFDLVFFREIQGFYFLRQTVFVHFEVLDRQVIDELASLEDANRDSHVDHGDFVLLLRVKA